MVQKNLSIRRKNSRTLFCLFVGAALLSACGKQRVRPDGGLFAESARGGIFGEQVYRSDPYQAGQEADLPNQINGYQIVNKKFDFPVVYNRWVNHWVKHFSGPGRRHFQIYLNRKAELEPIIIPEITKRNLPQDLIYLAMIESGFSTSARSHANAVGVWQFIRSTGRHYGLKQSWWLDERRDPFKATKAALTMLGQLYREFDRWELAAAAYNGGPARVRKAIRRYRTKDYWQLVNTRGLRRETKNYVPRIIAAAIISKNARSFGFTVPHLKDTWINTAKVAIPRPETLSGIANAAGISTRTFKKLNPELLRRTSPPTGRPYFVRLPKGRPIASLSAAVEKNQIGNYKTFKRYVIRRGDTLSQIAYRFGINSQSIMKMNNLSSARRIRPGKSLLLPIPHGSKPIRNLASIRKKAAKPTYYDNKQGVLHYKVRKGDTLYDISRKYEVSVRQIKRWNRIYQHKKLRPGRHIKLYVKNDNRQI